MALEGSLDPSVVDAKIAIRIAFRC